MLWQVLNVIHGYSLNPILRFFMEKYYHIDMSIFASEKKSKDKHKSKHHKSDRHSVSCLI